MRPQLESRGVAMSDASKKQRPADPPKRGAAAWRAQRDAIASRNEHASQLGRARRQKEYEQHVAEERAAEMRERAELAKLRP
jgi:post-segregation antitoxin (ccd killing protein)